MPGTRAGGDKATLEIKLSREKPVSLRASRSTCRPVNQAKVIRKVIVPMANGSQPPSANFMALAATKAKSATMNTPATKPMRNLDQCHRVSARAANNKVVIAMGFDTAKPNAQPLIFGGG